MKDVFIIALQTIQIFGYVLEGLIFVRVVLSWIPALHRSRLAQLVFALTEPILGPIRRLLAKSPLGGAGVPLDFSPFLALIAIQLAQAGLSQLVIMLWTAIQ